MLLPSTVTCKQLNVQRILAELKIAPRKIRDYLYLLQKPVKIKGCYKE